MASNYSEESTQGSDAIKLRLRKLKNIHSSVPINKQIRLKAPGMRSMSRYLSRKPAEIPGFTSDVFLLSRSSGASWGPP